MRRLFTSESVTEGHPDKVCDQISDAVLDVLLAQDPQSRVACETFATTGIVTLMGEITTEGWVDFADVARKVGGVRGVHKVRVRRYGRLYQADLHIQVDPSLSIVAGHDLGHQVQEAVVGAGIEVSDVVVHVEPDNKMPAQGD